MSSLARHFGVLKTTLKFARITAQRKRGADKPQHVQKFNSKDKGALC